MAEVLYFQLEFYKACKNRQAGRKEKREKGRMKVGKKEERKGREGRKRKEGRREGGAAAYELKALRGKQASS